MIEFDAALSGGEKVCTTVPAYGALAELDVTMTFSGPVTVESPADFVLLGAHTMK